MAARAMFLANHLSPEEFSFSPGALVLASPRQQDHILSILFCLFESSNDCTEKNNSHFFWTIDLSENETHSGIWGVQKMCRPNFEIRISKSLHRNVC